METTVTLQPPFEYSWWVMLLGFALLAAAIIMLVIAIRKIINDKSAERKKEDKPFVNVPPRGVVLDAKRRYSLQIQKLLEEYKGGHITKREGYQRLSLIIRGFVHETTGINVENCTLREIRELKMDKLNSLIQEYYVPEFGETNRAEKIELEISCKNAMGVIKSWN